MMVEQWHSVNGTVIVEKWKYVGIRVFLEQWNSVGGTVWWNSGTVMDEQCGRTVEQSWWNTHSGKVKQR